MMDASPLHSFCKIGTPLGTLTLLGNAEKVQRLAHLAETAAFSQATRNLFAKTDLSRLIFTFDKELRVLGLFYGRYDCFSLHGNRTTTEVFVHETAHSQQKQLGLSTSRPDIHLFDLFPEHRIAESAAITHQMESLWEIGKAKRGTWIRSWIGNFPFSAQMQSELWRRDTPETRSRAKAMVFASFCALPAASEYEKDVVDYVATLKPDALRRHLLAPKRPRVEYDAILAAHGLPDLHRHIPDLDWDSPAWSGISQKSHDRLYCIIMDKCPDLLNKVQFPCVTGSRFFSLPGPVPKGP